MNALPYYPRYPRDFLDGTAGMPLDLKGPYSILIDLIMMMGERGLPDDPHFVSGQLGCSVRKWNSIREKLIDQRKIYVKNGIISTLRADKEKIIQSKYRDKQAENASGPRKNNNLPKPSPTTVKDTDTDTEREVGKPTSCAPVHFGDFWNAYPHRGGSKKNRKGALAKYAAAVKRGTPEKTIIDGAVRYQQDAQVLRGYARDPTTWINQEGWTDSIENEPPQSSKQNGRTNGHDRLSAAYRAAEQFSGKSRLDSGPDRDDVVALFSARSAIGSDRGGNG